MSDFVLMLDLCTEPDILKVILFIETLLKYVFYIVPIGLIVMLMLDFAKNVIASNADEMQKNLKIAIKRLIFCVIMFLVPSIVSFVMMMVNDSVSELNVDYESCIANTKYIEYYEEQAAIEEAKKKEEEKKQTTKKATKKKIETLILSSSASGESSGELTLDWNDVTKISNVSAADLRKMLETSDYYGKESRFAPYATTYVDLERKNNVNVFLLLGIHAWESGWLGSNATRDCNNIAGVKYAGQRGAFKCIVTSEGDNYAGWSTLHDFLNYYVPWLKEVYLTEGGSYYNGKTPEGIVIKYNVGSQTWVEGVKSIGNGLFNQVKKQTQS